MGLKENAQCMINYFSREGIHRNAIVGIVCNSYYESTCNPAALQGKLNPNSALGIGLFQEMMSRVMPYHYAEHITNSLDSIEWQCHYLLEGITTGSPPTSGWIPQNGYTKSWAQFISGSYSESDSVWAFMNCFERPANRSQNRYPAKTLLDSLGVDWGGNTTTGSWSESTTTTPSGNTQSEQASDPCAGAPSDNTPSNTASPGSTPPPLPSGDSVIDNIVNWCVSRVNTGTYTWGGSTFPNTDCSGFIMNALNANGYSVPRWWTGSMVGILNSIGWNTVYSGNRPNGFNFQKGDIFIFGSNSAFTSNGHTGIMQNATTTADMNSGSHNVRATPIANYLSYSPASYWVIVRKGG